MTKFNDELNLDMDKVMANSVSHDDLMQEHLKDKDYQRIYLEISFIYLAAPVRFELTHRGVRVHCLTAWPWSNIYLL